MDPILLGEILALIMFFAIIGFLLFGFPVAFTLGGVSMLFALIGYWLGVFEPRMFGTLASRYGGIMRNDVLIAVPIFIFMGMMLERSGIAEQLLITMGRLFRTMRGGLGMAVIIVGALLAASTGVVGATVVTMGLLSLPAMLRAGYDPRLSSGVICASGSLGQIIPPSTVLIFMGDMLSGINQQVQMQMGNFAPQVVSVGDLFAGAFIPGLMFVAIFMLYMGYKAWRDPASCPALEVTDEEKAALLKDVVVSLVPPLLLICAVLGSILFGFATATESASVGAMGAMLLAAFKRKLTLANLRHVMMATATTTSMIFIILIGASVFALVFRTMGGDELVADFLNALPGGTVGAIIFIMLLMFFLGFILDTFEIIFLVVPITAPILLFMGVDPLWLGVIIAVNLQTSFLTPPFGFSLFYLRGVAPDSVTTRQIYEGAIPFVGLQIVVIALLVAFPGLVTWLPSVIR
ncbi:TRAP transporter large permease subunit [Natronospirillum operosum]|uniref:TRAP transporter large permease protein n=1 Tax=Natronospirillum operosum TaxID=2759953 RepID=A0A4Z0W6F4_9GAMM|nr:TRAP transporter large permease subunit [Natronospirillum operosum]TGG90094.1 TRAP transporter large permease subunit [Natronospirillum operosum]